ncbi:MAG: DUF1360 domain-containing protein [Candidatus Staskawiczbacteria bacterium]
MAAVYQAVVLALATATISVTVSKAKVFASAREQIAKRNAWLGDLVLCSYCTSHWVAFALVGIYGLRLVSRQPVVDFFVTAFAIVAVSAILCGTITRLIPFQGSHQQADVSNAGKELESLRKTLGVARKKIVQQQELIKQLQD